MLIVAPETMFMAPFPEGMRPVGMRWTDQSITITAKQRDVDLPHHAIFAAALRGFTQKYVSFGRWRGLFMLAYGLRHLSTWETEGDWRLEVEVTPQLGQYQLGVLQTYQSHRTQVLTAIMTISTALDVISVRFEFTKLAQRGQEFIWRLALEHLLLELSQMFDRNEILLT